MARDTTLSFIDKAAALHGDRFDYSAVQYTRSAEHVEVRCLIHGAFWIRPNDHLMGKACPRCATIRRKVTQSKPFDVFLKQASATHSDRGYQYDSSSYAGARTKMRITCPHHGDFWQAPEVHLRPSGCKRCSASSQNAARRITATTFLTRVATKFAGRISIRMDTWLGLYAPIEAECVLHGAFSTTSHALLYTKNGCPACARIEIGRANRLSHDEVITKLRQVFGDQYALSQVDVTRTSDRIQLECKTHGPFALTAHRAFQGNGCPKCARTASNPHRLARLRERVASAHEHRWIRFLDQAQKTHGNRYDYSRIEFRTQRNPVTIICPVHGEFQQVPATHIRSGCRKCADADLKGRYSIEYFQRFPAEGFRAARLYYVRMEVGAQTFYKVGITTTTIKQRFSGLSAHGVKIHIENVREIALGAAFDIEQFLLRHVATSTLRPMICEAGRPSIVGATECFGEPLPLTLVQAHFQSPASFDAPTAAGHKDD